MRALPTETKVESGTSPGKNETSFDSSNSGLPRPPPAEQRSRQCAPASSSAAAAASGFVEPAALYKVRPASEPHQILQKQVGTTRILEMYITNSGTRIFQCRGWRIGFWSTCIEKKVSTTRILETYVTHSETRILQIPTDDGFRRRNA